VWIAVQPSGIAEFKVGKMNIITKKKKFLVSTNLRMLSQIKISFNKYVIVTILSSVISVWRGHRDYASSGTKHLASILPTHLTTRRVGHISKLITFLSFIFCSVAGFISPCSLTTRKTTLNLQSVKTEDKQ
jgi:hypothetical protein